jgi:hypothetical protein
MFNRKKSLAEMDAYVEEHLSEYLDGTLSADERALIEAHLETSERARESLESLRWTVRLLKESPAPPLPRQFTLPLTPLAPAQGAPAWLVWGLRGVAVAATAAFVILLTATLLQPAPATPMTASAPPAVPPTAVAIVVAPTLPATAVQALEANDTAAPTEPQPLVMVTVPPPPDTAEPVPITIAPQPTVIAPTPLPVPVQEDVAPAAPPAPTEAPPPPPSPQPEPTQIAASSNAAEGNPPVELQAATETTTAPIEAQRSFAVFGVEGSVTAEQLMVREGPGMRFRVIGGLTRGQRVTLIGRTFDAGWLGIEFPENLETGRGWVAGAFVAAAESLETLPVYNRNGELVVIEAPQEQPPTVPSPPSDVPTEPPTSATEPPAAPPDPGPEPPAEATIPSNAEPVTETPFDPETVPEAETATPAPGRAGQPSP